MTASGDLSIEDLQQMGVRMTEEQIDFLQHPEDRLAVAVYGVPDPDRLYITGPWMDATLHQLASPGEPADENGLRAVVLPVVIEGGPQTELRHIAEQWLGELDYGYPVVFGNTQDADWTWQWGADEVPIAFACWDLWPIDADSVHAWSNAATRAYNLSKIVPLIDLIELYQGDNEYFGNEHEAVMDQLVTAQNLRYRLSQDDPQYQVLTERIAELDEQATTLSQAWVEALEQEILHPTAGVPDPQVPPIDLPPELAVVWQSLQALSWRNWLLLARQASPDGGLSLDGTFVEANRRLSPWF